MQATFQKYILDFKTPGGTSRGVLTQKETWFLIIRDQEHIGIGECGMFKGLSFDDRGDYEDKLQEVCNRIDEGLESLLKACKEFPSIQFGLEMAFKSLQSDHPFLLFKNDFSDGIDGIPINGLIWMGTSDFMNRQIKDRIKDGFRCIKMKIGAIDFNAEYDILKSIRKEFSASDIEIRVDANGAFKAEDALDKLNRLNDLELHSIEQPIKPRQWEAMAELCLESPLPIALDEELIGILNQEEKGLLLDQVQPQFIILKPSLIGGYSGSESWIDHAEKRGIGWWVTSALESNVGLNAIAQWVYDKPRALVQGLGTGSLFTNNFDSPLRVKNGTLHYDPQIDWNFNLSV